MSIQTKHARKIFEGRKQWEFRKAIPRGIDTAFESSSIVVYSAGIERAVIGEFTVGRVLATSLDELMSETGHADDPEAVTWFTRYYRDSSRCTAIEAVSPELYHKPVTLAALRRCSPQFRPPQNFIYLNRYPEVEIALKESSDKPAR